MQSQKIMLEKHKLFPAKVNPLLLSFHSSSKNKSVTLGLDTVCLNTGNRKTDKTIEKQMFVFFLFQKSTKLWKKDDNKLTQISRKVHKTKNANAYAKQNKITYLAQI